MILLEDVLFFCQSTFTIFTGVCRADFFEGLKPGPVSKIPMDAPNGIS